MRIGSIVAALLVLLSVGFAAIPATADQAPGTQHDVETVVETYNQNIDQVPDVIANRFSNERVAVTIERAERPAVTYTAVTDDQARVVEFSEGANDPTIRVETDAETIREIANTKPSDRREAALEAYNSDAVQVEGVGLTNTVKVETVEIGYSIANALGFF